MKNTNTNSNLTTRRWAMGKALLFIIIPMLLAAVAGTRVSAVDKIHAATIERMETAVEKTNKDKRVYLSEMEAITTEFASYQKLNEELLKTSGSVNSGVTADKIERSRNLLSKTLNRLEIALPDTTMKAIYQTSINNFRSMIANYDRLIQERVAFAQYKNENGATDSLLLRIEKLEEEKINWQEKHLNALRTPISNCQQYQLAIRQLDRQLKDTKQELRTLQSMHRSNKNSRQDKTVACNRALLDIRKKVEDLKLDCRIRVGCNNQFQKDKKGILHFINGQQLNLQKP